jgi:hypothetical protein
LWIACEMEKHRYLLLINIIKIYNVKKSKVYILNLRLNPIAFVAVFVFHMFRLQEVVQFEAWSNTKCGFLFELKFKLQFTTLVDTISVVDLTPVGFCCGFESWKIYFVNKDFH